MFNVQSKKFNFEQHARKKFRRIEIKDLVKSLISPNIVEICEIEIE